jgi:hypothetical protein
MSLGGDPQRDEEVGHVVVLPWRPPALGELPERPPAEVIPFPRPAAGDRPPDAPPRLAF